MSHGDVTLHHTYSLTSYTDTALISCHTHQSPPPLTPHPETIPHLLLLYLLLLHTQNYELPLQGKNEEVAFAEASLVEIQNLFDEARRGLPQSQGSRSGSVAM